MSRVFLSLLLVVNLVACPVRCLSSDATAAESPAPSSCCCCSHDTPETESEWPVSEEREDCPQEGCQCQNCICEGATIQDRPEMPGNAEAALCFVDPLVWIVACHGGFDFSSVHQPDRHASGRDVRIAHQSWLI